MTARWNRRVATVSRTAIFLFLLAATARADEPSPAPDLSSPKAAVAAFVKAWDAGDAKTLAAASKGNEKQQAWLRGQADQRKALRDLDDALAKRFGKGYAQTDAGKEVKEQLDAAPDDDLRDDLKQAKLGPEHDGTVLVLVDERLDDRQAKLVRVGGEWKLDLDALSDYLEPADVPGLKATAKAAAKLAKDVSADRFATLEAAGEAIDEALTAAEGEAAPAGGATKPAAPPKKHPRVEN